MIGEKLEELFALFSARHLLSQAAWSKLSLATVLPPVLTVLGLLIMIDYGYMLYLHFKMVRIINDFTHDSIKNSNQQKAPRPPSTPLNRKHTPPSRQQTLDLL